jgi:hypothetical protein
MGATRSTMGEMRKAQRILTDHPEWKKQLGRSRYKWDTNIETGLK